MLYTVVLVSVLFTLVTVGLYFAFRRVVYPLYTPEKGSHFAEIKDVKLHYIYDGQPLATGQKYLLLHGIAANVYCWRKLVPLLTTNNQVWALDLKGFGRSAKPWPSDYSLVGQSELVAEFIKKEIGAPCILVGNSMGGAIALETALRFPKWVSQLVLLAPAYDSNLVWLDLRNFKFLMPLSRIFAHPVFAKTIIKSLYGTEIPVSESDVDAYLNPFLENPDARKAAVEAFSALTDVSLKERLKKVTQPTFIVWGQRDRVTPVSYAEGISKRIPSSILDIHPTGGHHIQEEEPHWLAQRISQFVSEKK